LYPIKVSLCNKDNIFCNTDTGGLHGHFMIYDRDI